MGGTHLSIRVEKDLGLKYPSERFGSLTKLKLGAMKFLFAEIRKTKV